MARTCLPEQFKIVSGTAGALTTNGAIVCDYVSLKNCHRCTVVVHLDQAATDATAITLEKATAVAPTGSTAITVAVPIWMNADVETSDTLVRQTDAVGISADAGVTGQLIIFQVDPDTLGEGYDCLVCKIADSTESTNFASVVYYLETAHGQATPPAAITD